MTPLRDRSTLAVLSGFFCLMTAVIAINTHADPTTDRQRFRSFYTERFPSVALDEFALGVYAIDKNLRAQYDEINEFPPYEFALDEGAALVNEPFASGTTLKECLTQNTGKAINEFPYYDTSLGEIVTLPVATNNCRESNGEDHLSYRRGELSKILAHLHFVARGTRRAVAMPRLAQEKSAYDRGRRYFHTKRGQLNLSCADCHMHSAGKHLREQTLAPLLGTVNRYPVYGLRWGALGTLHQRFVGCLEQVRAEPADPQSKEFRELEYFLAIMSNGLPMTGPDVHR